jgi:hypothetical protein
MNEDKVAADWSVKTRPSALWGRYPKRGCNKQSEHAGLTNVKLNMPPSTERMLRHEILRHENYV